MKRLSPAAVVALEEALSCIYHYKADLRRFLEIAVGDRKLVEGLRWEDKDTYKRQIVRDLVGRLCSDQDRFIGPLTKLCLAVCEMTNLDHLSRLEDGESRVKTARLAVKKLKELVEPHQEARDEEAALHERERRAKERLAQNSATRDTLITLRKEFLDLATGEGTNQKRGFQLERLLKSLFDVFDLDPKASFRNAGEQIDGAFAFEGTDYLLEARWTKEPQNASALNDFDSKVRRKLDNTLGLFISINGYSTEAISTFSIGDRPKILLMDGADLNAILELRIELGALILRKKQHAARSGSIYLTVNQLLA